MRANLEELNRLKTEYQYREEELRRQQERKVQSMVNEQIEWTQEMKKEFASMIEENKQRIRLMQEEYDELKQLFDDRPSKEEDLRLIQKLQQLLEQREEELKRAWQELKFFKLELINRENNYNKMFSASPNIGVLDPFEAKTVPLSPRRNPCRRSPAAFRPSPTPPRSPSSDLNTLFTYNPNDLIN